MAAKKPPKMNPARPMNPRAGMPPKPMPKAGMPGMKGAKKGKGC